MAGSKGIQPSTFQLAGVSNPVCQLDATSQHSKNVGRFKFKNKKLIQIVKFDLLCYWMNNNFLFLKVAQGGNRIPIAGVF